MGRARALSLPALLPRPRLFPVAVGSSPSIFEDRILAPYRCRPLPRTNRAAAQRGGGGGAGWAIAPARRRRSWGASRESAAGTTRANRAALRNCLRRDHFFDVEHRFTPRLRESYYETITK